MFGFLKQKKQPEIFVQIAAYRDPECIHTIRDALKQAAHPERVHICVCWQAMPGEDDALLPRDDLPDTVTIIDVDARETEGVCWARHLIQTKYAGEDYALFIDSHMRFAEHWDEQLIAELALCPSDKPFLSTYPPAYTPPDKLDPNPRPTIMRAHMFNEAGDLRFRGDFLDRIPEVPLRGAFLAAGYIFTKGEVIREVPYDPYMYFNQEEISFAIRLWTHGWDIFAPRIPLIYHFYNTQAEGEKRPLHWDDNTKWSDYSRRGRARFNHLVGHAETDDAEALKDLDTYGFGATRDLASFEAFSGIDFKNRRVTERALRAEFIDNLDKYRDKPIRIPELDDVKSGEE